MTEHTKIKKQGEVFTPENIARFMVSFMNIGQEKSLDILEPACGNGAILRYIPKNHRVTGVDLEKEHVTVCKNAFPEWEFIHQDFLDFSPGKQYDIIIGNPPYVKIQNMPEANVKRMRAEYPHFIYGNTNLFVYFMAKCLDLLREDGRLIFIIPNAILYNKSMVNMKAYLMKNQMIEHLIDFKSEQVFENVSTYTCILVLTKRANPYYLRRDGMNGTDAKINYLAGATAAATATAKPGAYMGIEFIPRIGIMTLADDVFIIKEWALIEGKKTLRFVKDGETFEIEAGACQDILKVSKNALHKIIYPYQMNNGKVNIRLDFEEVFPKCYKYLLNYKSRLDNRDSGKVGTYPAWYAFGRTQSLMPHSEKRLFISAVVRNIREHLFVKSVPLYYSGLWLQPVGKNKSLSKIRTQLVKNEELILQNSNNRAGGWFALTHASFK